MTGSGWIAGLPMYDWPEVAADLDRFWTLVVEAARTEGLALPPRLTRVADDESIWHDPAMILGQVCALNPVRDGLGETFVLGTLVYEPPDDLPAMAPGSYYSVLVARAADPRAAVGLEAFAGATIAANGTDSQSGYWSLGHEVRHLVDDGPFLGPAVFTGAHRASVIEVAAGRADLAAIDVHSWRLALAHESEAAESLVVLGATPPTAGVVCVTAWELGHHRAVLDQALEVAADGVAGTETGRRLAISGYRRRSIDDFQPVADLVEAASRRPWHR